MNKIIFAIILTICLAVILISTMISYAKSETVIGKLIYDKYEHYPYHFEYIDDNYIALEVDLDKNLQNKEIEKFVGKIVPVLNKE